MEIHWRHPGELKDEEREAAEKRLRRLADGHTDLIDVWVDVEPSSDHHRKGQERVAIRCQARQADVVAHAEADEVGLALRRALQTFERDVRRLRSRRTDRRVEAPRPPAPQLGIVDRVLPEEGYGFLLTDDGEQVYFHRNAVGNGLRFEELQEGQRVTLNFEAGDEGPQATIVAPAPPGTPSP